MPTHDPYAAMADLDDGRNAHLSAATIARCQLCDTDGYRPNRTVCDHVNREHVGQAQKAHIRKMLTKDNQ